AALADRDFGLDRLEARSLDDDPLHAGVDRNRRVVGPGRDELAVALDHEAGSARRRGPDLDDDVRELALEPLRTPPCLGLALPVVARALGHRLRLAKRGPRAGSLAELLAAVAEVEQRADAALELLARGELVAARLELALLDERAALAKQRLGAGRLSLRVWQQREAGHRDG